MSDTTTQERRSALDDFAAQASNAVATVPVSAYAPPVDYAHGAHQVANYRDEAAVFRKLKALAAAAGDDWYYRWPVRDRKKGTTSWVEGPSIKLANDLWRIYGNIEVDMRVQDAGDNLLFYARLIDLETGSAMTRMFQQRKSAGTMGDDPDRRRDIAFQIGSSKAMRNVIVNALQTYADFALREAKESLVDRIGNDMERYLRTTIERIEARTDLARVEAVMGRSAKDWLAPDIAKVIAMMTAVAEGMATLDETFPPLKAAAAPAAPTQALDEFAKSASARSAPPPVDADAGAAADPSAAASAPVEDLAAIKREAIDKVLRIATDKEVPELNDRLANLDVTKPSWEDRLATDLDFIKTLFATSVKVAKGELDTKAARKYLAAL